MVTNDKTEKSHIDLELRRLKHDYMSVVVDCSKITTPYITGLFDVEGCVSYGATGTGIYCHIAQNACPQMLQAIKVIGVMPVATTVCLFVAR